MVKTDENLHPKKKNRREHSTFRTLTWNQFEFLLSDFIVKVFLDALDFASNIMSSSFEDLSCLTSTTIGNFKFDENVFNCVVSWPLDEKKN